LLQVLQIIYCRHTPREFHNRGGSGLHFVSCGGPTYAAFVSPQTIHCSRAKHPHVDRDHLRIVNALRLRQFNVMPERFQYAPCVFRRFFAGGINLPVNRFR
jgi:hypothetical protein